MAPHLCSDGLALAPSAPSAAAQRLPREGLPLSSNCLHHVGLGSDRPAAIEMRLHTCCVCPSRMGFPGSALSRPTFLNCN